jgi:hypothetical protein
MNGGGSAMNDERCIVCGEMNISGPLEGEKLLSFSYSFSIHEWVAWHLIELGYAS